MACRTITDTATTADGSAPVRLLTPEGQGPWPGIVMIPDAGVVLDRPSSTWLPGWPTSVMRCCCRMSTTAKATGRRST